MLKNGHIYQNFKIMKKCSNVDAQKIKAFICNNADGNSWIVADITNNIILELPNINLKGKTIQEIIDIQMKNQSTMSFSWYEINENDFVKIGDDYYQKIPTK
jgi:hypothetical protein